MGYCEDVLIDEMQSYLATSSLTELQNYGFPKYLKESDLTPFKKLFNSYYLHK